MVNNLVLLRFDNNFFLTVSLATATYQFDGVPSDIPDTKELSFAFKT